MRRNRKTQKVKRFIGIVLILLYTISFGQVAAFANSPPARCAGYGDLQSISLTVWTELGSWTVGTYGTAPEFDTPDWAVVGSLPDSRSGLAAFVADQNNGDCASEDKTGALTLDSPPILIPGGTQVPRISIDHWFDVEFGWDGGNLKINVNGGGFNLVPTSAIEFGSYNGTLFVPIFDGDTYNTNPLADQEAFTGTDGGQPTGSWGETRINLLGIAGAGDTVQLRFDFGVDQCGGSIGWYVDDVEFYSCEAELPPSDCGNEVLDPGEQCDDGNDFIADGCSNTCQVEDEWQCTAPTLPTPIPDHSFEDGTPNAFWAEVSNNGLGTPICNESVCGTGLGTGAYDGTFWAWFGGTPNQEGSVSQSVVIPASASELTFELEIPVCALPADFVEVLIDGNQEFLIDGSSPLCGIVGYSTQSVDISAYADDGAHDLEFHSITGDGFTNFFIDAIALPGSPSMCTPVPPHQTITGLAADPAAGVVDGTSALSATASSGLAVTFGSSTPGVCTVAGSTVTYIASGTCTVTADQAGDVDYNPASQVTLGISVVKADQTITGLAADPAAGVVDGTSALSATASSGLTVTFDSSTPGVCSVAGNTVTFLTGGTCTVTADQAGDANYNAASQVPLDISVGKAEQTITGLAADPATGVVDGTSALSATASSGLTVSFDSSTPGVCTVAGSTVTYIASGTCTVTADQAGDDNYNPAPQVTLGINVAKADQTISDFTADPVAGVVDGTSALSATASSGLTVTFDSSTPGVCTVAGNTVTYLAAGTCTVTADQAGDANYNAATQETLNLTVSKADQTITGLAAVPATGVVDGTSALSATASSGLTVSFDSSTPGVCSVAGSTVTYLTAGTCTVTADQAGDANYNAAPQVNTGITVAMADQIIENFAADPANGTFDGTSELSATGGASGEAVTFGSSTLGICTVAGSTVTYVATGTCTVTANQAGNADYNAAPQVTLDIGVDKTDQTISGFTADPAAGVVDGTSALSATASSGLTVTFDSSTPGVCSVAGSTVTFLTGGTCTVTADQAGDANYNAASQVPLDISVGKAEQTIIGLAADPVAGVVDGSSALSATASSGLTVTFDSSTPGACTIAGSTVTYIASGTCTVTADQAGDDNYNPAPQVTLGISVAKAEQTISDLAADPAAGVVDGTSALSATASSGLTVTFDSSTPGVCSVAGSTVTYLAAGTCTVTADQAGDDDYNAATQETLNLTVSKADQAISDFAADPATGSVDGTSALSATASSGLAVSFDSSTPGVCTVAGSTVTYIASGTCTVTADQAGDANYNAAPQVNIGITVAMADQIIEGFAADPAAGVVDGSSALSATASSGLIVTFGSSTGAVCTVDGSTVTYLTAGTCTVTANQAGNADYNAAPQVTLDIGVDKTDQTISGFTADPATGVVDGTSALSATASSGLTVTFDSSTPGVCTVAGNAVTYLAAGTCTVTADQAGDDDYNAATQETLNLTVSKADQTITGLAADPAAGVVDGTSALSATASSGLTVSFDSSTPGVCSVAGSTVTYLTAGTCTVTADQAGDANYNAAPQVNTGITVAMADQIIEDFAADPANGTVDGTSELSATGGASGEAVTFGSSTLGICTVAGSTVTYVATGTCTVTANQAGNADYNAAPQVTLDIGVDKTDQTISGFTADPAAGVVDGTSALSATASSGLTVTFDSSTPGVCSVAGNTVTFLTGGTCTVTADQAGDANYNAASQVPLDISVGKAEQTITGLAADPATGVVDGTSALSATASSGLTVSFDSSTPGLCTVAGSTVTYIASGTCTVTADQAGDDNYNPAPQVTLGISVAKADQTISGLAADPAAGVVDGTSALSATASSGLTVTFDSSTPGVCSVAGSTVNYLAAGTCTVTANQTGDDDYNAAPQVTTNITVAKADQTISAFTANPANGTVDEILTLSATASSGLAVTFGSSTPAICTVAGGTVTLIASGTCTVTANQAGDVDYNPAPQVPLNIGVDKTDQTIIGLAADPAAGVVDGSSALSATASSGLAVTFGSSTGAVCTVAGSTVTYLTAGTCTVTANQAGDDDYNAAPQVTTDIAVGKAEQTITGLAADPVAGVVDGSSALSATASSGLAVTFGSSTGAVCTVDGSTVTYLTAGTCTVTANQAGDANYNAAPQVTLDIGVDKTDQTISGFIADPATGVVDGTSALSATASSGLTVTFDSSTPGVCSVAGSTVTFLTGGTCTVTADQAGDANYNAASQVPLDISVGKAEQTIIGLAADPVAGVVDGNSALSATASSGLTVTFDSSTPGACTVAGSTVTYIASGTCTVTADQAGDDNYNPAPQVTLGISVAKAEQTISDLAADPATGVVDGTSALSATASSGLAVTFGSSTGAVCTVDGSTVTYLTAGTCTVTADQAGDVDYNPAPQVTLGISVAKADQTISGLAADPATGVVDGTSALSATASSGLTVIFGSSTGVVCTVDGSTVTYLTAGTCTVTADQAGDVDYNPAPQVPLNISVAKAEQTISGLAADPATGVVDGTSALSATASSGLTVIFGSSTPGVCTVAGSTVTYIASGICTVTADQAGDDNYNPAPQVPLNISVAKAEQTISGLAADPAAGVVDGTSALSATASSGLTVTFDSSTPGVCTVDGSTVTYLTAGACTVTADQAGDVDYNPAAQVTLGISVAKADQTISDLAADPAAGVVDGTSALSATASSGLAVTFGSSTGAVCTVVGSTVTYLTAGTCTVTADQAGDVDYNPAAQVTLGISVAKAEQTISDLAADPAAGVVDGTSALSATASSGLTVTFGSSTGAVCTVDGSTVTYLTAGTCMVTADQAGDDNYNPAPQVTTDIAVGKAEQTISGLAADPVAGVVDGTSALSATASSGLTVTFGSSTGAVCTVVGSTVTYLTAGTCTVTANQAGDDDYNAAPQVTTDIAVGKAEQTITGLAADPATGVVDGTSALSATASSGLAVTFGSSTGAVCTVVGSTVTYLTAGTCTVTADQAGDVDYNPAAQVTLGISVAKAEQTISDLAADPAAGVVDGTSALSATASSGLTVIFGSSTGVVCTVDGSTVTYLTAGTCTVTADQAGDVDYNPAAQVTLGISVAKAEQTISDLAADPAAGVVDGTSALSATASSGLAVTFGSSTGAVCTVDGSTVTYLTAGACTVTADQAGDVDYNPAAQVTLGISVAKAEQTISDLAADPAAGVVDGTSALSATASSGLAVTFGSSTGAVCTVDGSTVTYLTAGACTVTADQTGDDDYNAAPQVTTDIAVDNAEEIIFEDGFES